MINQDFKTSPWHVKVRSPTRPMPYSWSWAFLNKEKNWTSPRYRVWHDIALQLFLHYSLSFFFFFFFLRKCSLSFLLYLILSNVQTSYEVQTNVMWTSSMGNISRCINRYYHSNWLGFKWFDKIWGKKQRKN